MKGKYDDWITGKSYKVKMNKKYKKRKDALLERFDEKFYVAMGQDVYEVNEVGARIFELCNGKNDIEEISRKISSHFNVDNNQVLEDVIIYTQMLYENTLIEIIE